MTLLPSFERADFRSIVLAFAVALAGAGLLATPVQAQEEEPKPKRLEGVTWNNVTLIDFKSGKEERAMELIEKQFIPVLKKAGNPIPHTIELQTGPWDLMLVGTMDEGPSEMNWETSPEEVKNMKAANEMLGKEKAQKISDEYSSLIARETSFVGFSGRHGPPITADMQE